MSTRLGPEDIPSGDPIRSWNKLYRTSDEPESVRPDDPSKPDDASEQETRHESMSWDSIANDAIERGYQVIEEQIRQGAEIARHMRGYKDEVQEVNNDISRLVESSLGFYKDFGSLWFDFVQSFLRNPAIANGDLYQAVNPRANATSSPGSSVQVPEDMNHNAVEISLDGARVRIDIDEPVRDDFIVQPLRAIDESIPAIRNVEFLKADGRAVLNVAIPPDQPNATYVGVIMDKRSNLPKGTVSVVVDKNQA